MPLQFEWIKTWGGPGHERVFHSDVDPQGNIVSVGHFQDSCDFEPGPGRTFLKGGALPAYNAYVQKVDMHGNLLWARVIPSNVYCVAKRVAFDPQGNIYISGLVSKDSLDLDPDPTRQFIVHGNGTGRLVFFVKAQPTGKFYLGNKPWRRW